MVKEDMLHKTEFFQETLENDAEKTEALALFQEISSCATQVAEMVKRLKSRFDQGELSVAKGISLLDVRNQLMVQYLANVTHFIMLKVCGKQIEGDPVIDRLIELRVVLERIRPIEQKLKYQTDKLVKMAVTGHANENDPINFKANPSNMLGADEEDSSSESDEEEEGAAEKGKTKDKKPSNVYVPPKLAAVHYDGDEAERKAKALERARRFALNSSVLQELKEEYLDTPVEVATTNSARQTHDRQQKQKQEYEETYFTRLPITKEEKRRSKKLSTLGTIGDELTHFQDISVLQTGELRSSKKRKRGGIKKKGKQYGKKRRKK